MVFQNKARKQREIFRVFREFLPKWGPGTTFFQDFGPIFRFHKIAPKNSPRGVFYKNFPPSRFFIKMVPRSHFYKKAIFLKKELFWEKVLFLRKVTFLRKRAFLSKSSFFTKKEVFLGKPKISQNFGQFSKRSEKRIKIVTYFFAVLGKLSYRKNTSENWIKIWRELSYLRILRFSVFPFLCFFSGLKFGSEFFTPSPIFFNAG